MASIFSTQNLQTFLRRKYFRPPGPPSRPPPGPPGREDGRRSPRSGRSPPEDDSDVLVSSAMMLLKFVVCLWSFVVGNLVPESRWPTTAGQPPTTVFTPLPRELPQQPQPASPELPPCALRP